MDEGTASQKGLQRALAPLAGTGTQWDAFAYFSPHSVMLWGAECFLSFLGKEAGKEEGRRTGLCVFFHRCSFLPLRVGISSFGKVKLSIFCCTAHIRPECNA